MKNLILLFLSTIIINNCSDINFNSYEGFIYNKNAPYVHLKIFEKDFNSNFTFTNDKVFFKLKKRSNSISTFLMIQKNNKIIDSIQVIRTSGGEKINYSFIEGRNDTLFIDLK
ncbi:hypothetical protein ASG22_17605 [Chryseobacterium sp. Leaf405]|uniref:hypothetical protein n=1 Tax=Chryseobacterium sp. Leaf405 TaxID=1736367 RepID=UPI0006F660DD|nr:hypothetical protein [Chryseobacterium sp. Leaf405]KQT33914.1 hypothetical protein ASG22_17605 [Chryseobacterium sp. Leaf405]